MTPPAFPQAATIPECLVCEIACESIFPPTVSTTPSQTALPSNFGSPSNSDLFIMFFAPNLFNNSALSGLPVTAVTL